MDSVAQIEESIVRDAEGFFDEAKDREDLHVTIRIARDFYDFLIGSGESPAASDIEYVTGTIRSGLGHFFALAHDCAIINTPMSNWTIDGPTSLEFPSLKEDFIRRFESLARREPATAVERLACLLALSRLELLFLAQNFPSAILDLSGFTPR